MRSAVVLVNSCLTVSLSGLAVVAWLGRGIARVQLTRYLPPLHPAQGANRPSPRAITLALFNKPYFKGTSEMNSSMLASGLGQLICKLQLQLLHLCSQNTSKATLCIRYTVG